MGNQFEIQYMSNTNRLPNVSPTCLPYPNDEDTFSYMKQYNIIFPENKSCIMCEVKLPEGWGLLCIYDLDDIWRGYLLNEKGTQQTYIFRSSNIASMKKINHSKSLKLNEMEFKNGWWTKKPTVLETYCNLLIDYYNNEDGDYLIVREYYQKHRNIIHKQNLNGIEFFTKQAPLTVDKRLFDEAILLSKPFRGDVLAENHWKNKEKNEDEAETDSDSDNFDVDKFVEDGK
jgi:hypothetical protein